MSLSGASRAGYLVPRGALIYEEGGAFVYHQLNAKAGDDKTQYVRKKVTLLMQSGEGWLVDGLDDDDRSSCAASESSGRSKASARCRRTKMIELHAGSRR